MAMDPSPPTSPANSPRPIVDRFFDSALLLTILVVCGFAFSLLRAEPDLWGHVQYGRDALRDGLHRTTTYSFTAEGYRWMNHENLSELLFAAVTDRLGVWALLAGKCLLGIAMIGTMLWHANRQKVSVIVAAASMMLISVNLIGFWYIRPQVLSYVLFASLIGLLSFGFRGWEGHWHLTQTTWLKRDDTDAETTLNPTRLSCLGAAAILFIVWTNTHGAFLAGLCVFIAYLVMRAIEVTISHHPDRRRTAIRLIGIAGIVALVTLINPYGYKLHAWLLESLTIPRPEILEWHPIQWTNRDFVPFTILAVVSVAGLLYSRRSLDATQLVILALTFWQAASHQRHIPFLTILCGFWLPIHWQSVWQRYEDRKPVANEMSPRAKFGGALGLILVSILIAGILVTRCQELPVERDQFPISACEYAAQQELSGRLVVTFNWAQYAIVAMGNTTTNRQGVDGRLPTTVSFDGRFRTCYPLSIIDQHFDFVLGTHPAIARYRSPNSPAPDPSAILSQGNPDLVLISRKQSNPVNVMIDNRQDWTLLYQDQLSQLWGRKSKYGDPTSSDFVPPANRDISDSPQSGSVPWPALPFSEQS